MIKNKTQVENHQLNHILYSQDVLNFRNLFLLRRWGVSKLLCSKRSVLRCWNWHANIFRTIHYKPISIIFFVCSNFGFCSLVCFVKCFFSFLTLFEYILLFLFAKPWWEMLPYWHARTFRKWFHNLCVIFSLHNFLLLQLSVVAFRLQLSGCIARLVIASPSAN